MRFLSLFAGIGGFDAGFERAGFRCAGQVEIDPFCRRVLAARFDAPRWTDVREWTGDGNEQIDLLCGGFPCQDLSVAGKRAGLKGERSGLFREIIRIAKILRPAWGLFENVPGLISSGGGTDMLAVVRGLRECWPVVGWRVLDSRHFGVAQRRRRVFFVCGPTEAGVRAVLFEPEGGGGDFEACDEKGTRVAASLTSGVGAASNDPGRRREDDVNLIVQQAISSKWSKGSSGPAGDGHHNLIIGPIRTNAYNNSDATMEIQQLVHCLSSEGTDASEDGTGRGTPIVTALRHLGGGGPDDNEAQGGHLIPIQDVRGIRDKRQNGIGVGIAGDPMFTLDSVSRHAVGVRRLTPLECERLQAFPDGWTCLCQPMEAYTSDPDGTSLACKCPDSPRYRALGNAVTVNVVEWIGRRLMDHLEREAARFLVA